MHRCVQFPTAANSFGCKSSSLYALNTKGKDEPLGNFGRCGGDSTTTAEMDSDVIVVTTLHGSVVQCSWLGTAIIVA